MKKVAVILADGFEEIEALTSVDVLRRAGVLVSVVGLSDACVRGTHNIVVKADVTLREMRELNYDAVVLPGGLPGASNLANDADLKEILRKFDKDGKLICAICAAPMALESAGVLKDSFVCYPGFEENVRSDKRGYVNDKNRAKRSKHHHRKGPCIFYGICAFYSENLLGEETYIKVKDDLLYK